MKTIISEKAAIALLENIVIQQGLCDKLADVFPSDAFDYAPKVSNVLESIFNVDMDSIDGDMFEIYLAVYNDAMAINGDNHETKARKMYREFAFLSDPRRKT